MPKSCFSMEKIPAGVKRAFPNYLKILQGKQKPRFQIAKKSGLLDKKIKEARAILKSCELCERRCRVDRTRGQLGFCRASLKWRIFGAYSHMGEEAELVPSATLFMAGCSMACAYCQNAPVCVEPELGQPWTEQKGARWIERKLKEGCKNINFVGGEPTIYLYNILKCLKLCRADIPVVWNSNAYYTERTAKLLKGLIDIYLLDFRYFSERCARKLSSAPGYPEAAKRNFSAVDSELLVRVLVMPGHIKCDAKPILKWIRDNLGPWTRVNILGQYNPAWQAEGFPEINRLLKPEEYAGVISYAKRIGLRNIILQEQFLYEL